MKVIGFKCHTKGFVRQRGDLIGDYNPGGGHGVGQFYDYGTGRYTIK
jgi:hypothetical protein